MAGRLPRFPRRGGGGTVSRGTVSLKLFDPAIHLEAPPYFFGFVFFEAGGGGGVGAEWGAGGDTARAPMGGDTSRGGGGLGRAADKIFFLTLSTCVVRLGGGGCGAARTAREGLGRAGGDGITVAFAGGGGGGNGALASLDTDVLRGRPTLGRGGGGVGESWPRRGGGGGACDSSSGACRGGAGGGATFRDAVLVPPLTPDCLRMSFRRNLLCELLPVVVLEIGCASV